MATVIATSEEDPVLSVVRFTSELAWADAGPEVAEPQVTRLCREAEECMVTGKMVELASLMLTSAELIQTRVSDKDLECIMTVISSLVTRAATPSDALQLANLISSKIVQHSDNKPALRLKILFNLYNLVEDPQSRFAVYMKALELAAASKVTESVIASFKKMDSFLSEWNLGKMEQRALFLAVSNIFKSMGKESFEYLSKYLATFSAGEDSDAMNAVKEDAVRAVVDFIKSPHIFQSELLEMAAVRQLEQDEKHAKLYELLKIFLTGRLDAYLQFQGANSALLKSHGLVHEDCVSKMRLMTLLHLASLSSHIPYALIRDTLQINDDEVEYWVVKAITSKLLDCKMDQMNQLVIVSRHTERVFGLAQWRSLQSKLTLWRGNVASAISTIKANRVSEEGVQQPTAQGLGIRA